MHQRRQSSHFPNRTRTYPGLAIFVFAFWSARAPGISRLSLGGQDSAAQSRYSPCIGSKTKAPQTLSSHGTPCRTVLPPQSAHNTLCPEVHRGNGSDGGGTAELYRM